jgi:zinc protease
MNARNVWVLVLVSSAAVAQPFETPPPPGPPRPVVIAAPDVATLDNGLRVVVAPRRGLPLVTAELVVRSGSETDPAPLAGLADITATLLTKGTAKHTAPQIAEAAEASGRHARQQRRVVSLHRDDDGDAHEHGRQRSTSSPK